MTVSEAPGIDSLLVADWAEAINGKLYVQGAAFDTLWAPQYPHAPRFFFAAVLKVPWNDTNRRLPIRGWVESKDGDELGWKMEGELEAGRPPGQRGGDAQVVIAGPVQFEVSGPTEFTLHIDFAGDSREVSLRVAEPPFTPNVPRPSE
jgi:hypothetical protein